MEKYITIKIVENKFVVEDDGFSASESMTILRTVANFIEENLKKDYISYNNKFVYARPLDKIGLSLHGRAYRALKAHGVKTLRDLTLLSIADLKKIKNLGGLEIKAIEDLLYKSFYITLRHE